MMNSLGSGSSDSSILLGAELLSAAREGRGGGEILRILEGDPTLIHVTDPVGDTTLHIVARAGNLEVANQVVGLVRKHKLTEVLMEQNLQGDTPLHLAIANRHERVALVLCQAESRAVSVPNEDGVNPSALASEAGFVLYCFVPAAGTVDIELELIWRDLDESRHGNDNNKKSDAKLIIDFHQALKDGREDLVVEALADHPYLASRRLCFVGTFLHLAAKLGQVGMLRLMVGQMTLDEAASLMLEENGKGCTPLHIALKGSHKDVASYLTELAPRAAYQVDKNGVSPLYLAVERGYEDLVKFVFQMIPVASISSSTRQSLLTARKASLGHAAIKARKLSILKSLMKELPELINVLDDKGWRVLSYAAYKGYLDGVRFLLKNFPNSVKEYDLDGSLPIHKAVGGGHVSIVKEFLMHCPETLYYVDKKGQSVLHFAVKCTRTDVLTYLTKETAEAKKIFSLKDNQGKTFIDLANELQR